MTLFSFIKFNPDWDVHLITNTQAGSRVLTNTIEKQDSTEYKGEDYSYLLDDLDIDYVEFESSMIDLDPATVSKMSDVHIKDILNWKILSEVGGIVADMDILFLRSINDAILSVTKTGLVCFDGYPKKGYIPVSLMYSSGDNAFFEKTYRRALANYIPNIYECCGTMCIEEHSIKEIAYNFPEITIEKLDDHIAFPLTTYPWKEGIRILYSENSPEKLHPETVGIHWYGGNPTSQHFNNIINKDSLNEINNTMTAKIKEII